MPTIAAMPSRRDWFGDSIFGLGGIALAWLLQHDRPAHARVDRPAKARRVIQVFCPGGVSHVDTFDYKPELAKQHGKPLTGKKIDTFFGQPGNLMQSPFKFRRHGQGGHWMSDLFPELATVADDLTYLHSMQAKSSNHTPAAFQMNSGFTMNGFPSMGAWLSYGLGSISQDLPAFVVLPDPRGLPAGGAINWTSGFLPAQHQGVAFRSGEQPIPDLFPPSEVPVAERQAGLALLDRMNRDFEAANPGDSTLTARIRSYELAARMQKAIPEVTALDRETEATRRLYGLDRPELAPFGRNCLLARRLIERGVRFVQIWNGGAFGSPRINWDAHENIVDNHTKQAATLDRPLAALLKDLKQRGLLADTLLLWTTEFGRTPITQGINAPGRDHHPQAFTIWLAGAGLKPGFHFGATDEFGYQVTDHPLTIYDFHATVLHLLGIDHKQLTYYHNGINRRLTDVHGEVIEPILA